MKHKVVCTPETIVELGAENINIPTDSKNQRGQSAKKETVNDCGQLKADMSFLYCFGKRRDLCSEKMMSDIYATYREKLRHSPEDAERNRKENKALRVEVTREHMLPLYG